MKMTKLSLVAALAVSAAFAGGDIAPVEPVVAAPATDCNKATTVAGKLQGYYITDDSSVTNDMFSKEQSQLGLAATLDVTHNFTDNIAANFSAVGYLNALKKPNLQYMEGSKKGAFFNVANITATFADTTFILGRQLIDSPMFGGFDWLLAPGAFEAYTIANKSIDDLTLVGTYVTKWRANNTGDFGSDLAGDNFALGAVYNNKDLADISLWFYNIDANGGTSEYTQVYVDAAKDIAGFNIAAQYVNTNYNGLTDAQAYGLKIGTEFAGINLSAAYNKIQDNNTAFVGVDSLYTSSWNTFASAERTFNGSDIDAFKLAASTEFAGINAEVSYADYDKGNETDVILGYGVTESINLDAIYTNTKASFTAGKSVNALELVGTYKF